MLRRTRLTLVCTFLALALCPPAQAQADDAAKQHLADTMIRNAVSLIGYSDAVESDAPATLAATALDTAIELDPDNTQAWAMRVELARASGDAQAHERVLAGYLDTGVRDARASFELVRLRLMKKNTLDAQLASLEELLGSEAGRALNAPLRSRLASYAAQLATELLNESARRKWAVEAARADPANRQAAQMMLDLVIELGGDSVRQSAATVNLIRASPLEPGPRLQLAATLADQSAYAAAAEQYQVVATRLSPDPLSLDEYIRWAQCLAISGQDEVAMQLIDEFDKALNQPDQGDEEGEEEGEEAGEEGQAELDPAPLPLELELVKLAVLDPETDQAQTVFDRVADRLRQSPQAPEQEEDQEQSEQAEQELARRKADRADQLAMLAAVFAPDLEQAQQIVADHQQNEDATDWVNTVARGWLALRRGERQEAQDLLGPVAERHGLASIGLALATGDDAAGRAGLVQSVLQETTPSFAASLAAGRALRQNNASPKPTAAGQAVRNLMSKYPRSFWQADLDSSPWIEARFSIDPARIKPMQPIRAEVTVWNTSRFPLAIGERSPIKPSAVVVIDAASSGRRLPRTPPIVINLDRRYSLAAGERMVFDTRLDYHQFGSLRQLNPGAPIVFTAKLVINPTPNRAGKWLPGPIGRTVEVRNVLIESSSTNQKNIDRWLETLDEPRDAEQRLYALQRLAALSKDNQPDLVDDALLERSAPKLQSAWGEAGDVERAWILYHCKALSDPDKASYPALLERAQASDSKLVWLSLLMSQVNDAQSPLLGDAVRRQDLPEVSRYAETLRRLLREIEELEDEQEAPATPLQPDAE